MIFSYRGTLISINHPSLQYDLYNGSSNISITLHYPCSSFSSCSEISIFFSPGLYLLEVWGAQGGSAVIQGGLGGYSSGFFRTYFPTQLFLHIGGSLSSNVDYLAGYNGGGYGLNIDDGPGGGATDFRTISGPSLSNLGSRIIVAGGGGGAYTSRLGGKGGGLQGSSEMSGEIVPCYGTQNGCDNDVGGNSAGVLGSGASGYYGSGGGGYYGGGNAEGCGGGGGSGYIGGVDSISNYVKNSIAGVNVGQGKARITIISLPRFNTCDNEFINKYFTRLILECIITLFTSSI